MLPLSILVHLKKKKKFQFVNAIWMKSKNYNLRNYYYLTALLIINISEKW